MRTEKAEKYAGLYIGQEVMRATGWEDSFPNDYVCLDCMGAGNFYLVLKPLTQITEEDVIEVAQLQSSVYLDIEIIPSKHGNEAAGLGFSSRYESSSRRRNNWIYYSSLNWRQTDYLRSKGYYVGDGTEVEEGIVMLTELKKDR